MLSGSPDPSSTYRLPWESVHVLVMLTPSAVDQNVLIRSVSRQSMAMAARRLVTGSTFLGGTVVGDGTGAEAGKSVVSVVARARRERPGACAAGGEGRRPDRRLETPPSNSKGSGSGDVRWACGESEVPLRNDSAMRGCGALSVFRMVRRRAGVVGSSS